MKVIKPKNQCNAVLGAALLDELESFFVFYHRQRNETFTPLSRGDAARATELLEEGRRRRQKDPR